MVSSTEIFRAKHKILYTSHGYNWIEIDKCKANYSSHAFIAFLCLGPETDFPIGRCLRLIQTDTPERLWVTFIFLSSGKVSRTLSLVVNRVGQSYIHNIPLFLPILHHKNPIPSHPIPVIHFNIIIASIRCTGTPNYLCLEVAIKHFYAFFIHIVRATYPVHLLYTTTLITFGE